VVTVDPDLGLVRVERMAGAWGAGRILNHKTAESQMRGGGMMGIGQALLEGSATDPNAARLLNPGLNEYLIPTHADAPPISVTFIEEHDPYISPLGSMGIGGLPVVGAAAAIANAVFHATGTPHPPPADHARRPHMSRLERLPRRSDRPLDVHAAARGGVRDDLPGRGGQRVKGGAPGARARTARLRGSGIPGREPVPTGLAAGGRRQGETVNA
jgi:Molybdopterin-binding domain of aldehyde dehydrogenase